MGSPGVDLGGLWYSCAVRGLACALGCATIAARTLQARERLARESRDLLEGTYTLYPGGRLKPAEKLLQVQADPEAGHPYRRLVQFMDDEARAGLPHQDAVDKLVEEVACAYLNRVVAFKALEARKSIKGMLDKDTDSNAVKFYLVDLACADDLARY